MLSARWLRSTALAVLLVAGGGLTAIAGAGTAAAAAHPAAAARSSAAPTANVLPLERITAPVARHTGPDAPIGGGGGECTGHQSIKMFLATKTLRGSAFLSNCVGALDCVQTADLQIEANPGVWGTVENGPTTYGCGSGNASNVAKVCNILKPGDNWAYRTRAIFIIYWDNGGVTGPVDYYSPDTVGNWLC
jgi:hypothetical protein